jgi:ubiquinone/menaquinone biosynthesis C-methylase UbiE
LAKAIVPALRWHALTRIYDPVMRLTMREHVIKRALLEQASLQPGHRVLDLGCGTGTLTLMASNREPAAELIAIDADFEALAIAAAKADAASAPVTFVRGDAAALPFPTGNFDRVISSLLFHHLVPAAKEVALREVHRVLRTGGELHIADWGEPANLLMWIAFHGVSWLDGIANTKDHAEGRFPAYIAATGFEAVKETACYATVFGSLRLLSVKK